MIKYFTIEDLLKHYLQKKFHILDHFADPLCQDIPEQWSGASAKEIEKYVYDYTYQTVDKVGAGT